MIRVFPRRTKWTPSDPLAFVGDPPLQRPLEQPVLISVVFTWDIPEGKRLLRSWSRFYSDVQLGGPAFGDCGGEFVPGRFLKSGAVITSRGCIRSCSFCMVPMREGRSIRHLRITEGFNVLDNNLLACSETHIIQVFNMLGNQKSPAVFSGGLDARLLQPWHVELLKSIRVKSMFFACDSRSSIRHLRRAAKLLHDFSREKKRCYVLIGFRGETLREAEARLKEVYAQGFLPFAMLYQGPDAESRDRPEFHDLTGTWRNPRAYKVIMEGPRSQLRGGVQLRMSCP